ncbi:hypothetical protein CO172_01620 [Candidatus Uhrbacteria bacterium CG_4_9_14_3_um_filter_36_7]|uniref:Uncharacterized protein n=1 Tax=Candidatus Uhrbacteria bacterium CG_4_9_14_3_um_filter_36_7 TaxID=1975033 RepID=A0A2M7XHQ0_9BACT|nr:MAG: hypothetical protein CO172_01620 [Candidatus Uhrbacteria bacterium CG_4_9_14_3_um_filter_36_7]
MKNADNHKPLLFINLLLMETPKVSWYHKLLHECRAMIDRLQLNEQDAELFQSFVTRVAKDQYKIGNSSGIRWAFRKQKENESGAPI